MTTQAQSEATTKPLTQKQMLTNDKREACEKLREWLVPGQTVYTVLRHVSSSGMRREISLFADVTFDGVTTITSLDYYAAAATGYRRGKAGGIIVGGCGMDMGFSLVYNLGSVLWREGTPTPHGMRNGEPDSSGGYALKHRWL